MTVKELKEKLEEFDDDMEVVIEQQYNSGGGAVGIDRVVEYDPEKSIIIEGDYWW